MFLRGLGNMVHSEVSVEIGHISISLKRNCHGACLMAERLKLYMLYFCGAGSQFRILSADLLHSLAMLWTHPTCKMEEDWHTRWLSDNLPQAKRGR